MNRYWLLIPVASVPSAAVVPRLQAVGHKCRREGVGTKNGSCALVFVASNALLILSAKVMIYQEITVMKLDSTLLYPPRCMLLPALSDSKHGSYRSGYDVIHKLSVRPYRL